MDNQQTSEQQGDNVVVEEMDFNNPQFKFEPADKHGWRQEGPYIVCRQACNLEHATYIGMDKIMIGIDENNTPILTARV